MNWKRLLICFVVVYVVAQTLTLMIHAGWLAPTYAELADVWRPEAELMSNQWIMLVTSAFFCFFFCYIFARGYEDKGWQEGLRYGAIIGLFVGVPAAYDAYAIYPIPYSLALKWFLSGLVLCLILGLVASLVYKKT